MKKLFSWLIFLLGVLAVTAVVHPIILVPGDGGNQLQAKLDKESVAHYLCQKKTDDYFVLWLNLKLLVPVAIGCLVDNMKLVYNSTTRKTVNSPGVDIRIPGFGETATVENVEAAGTSVGNYFKAIVEESLVPIGYERNVSIRGAPYDFRKAPNELHDWLLALKRLIEETYVFNGNMSVILMSHSMGSPISQYFLHGQSSKWRMKYIRALISLGGVWGGSVKALKVFASGDNFGSFLLSSKLVREEQKTFPSTAWLFPSKYFWSRSENLVTVNGKRNYTVGDYKQLFWDMNQTEGYEMRTDTENLLDPRRPPGVEIYCVHGTGISTVESLSYSSVGSFPLKPKLNYGNGDGTVNVRSLRGCRLWKLPVDDRVAPTSLKGYMPHKRRLQYESAYGQNTFEVHHKEFPGLDHMSILTEPSILNYIQTTVQSINYEGING